jgi:hypothetical protein
MHSMEQAAASARSAGEPLPAGEEGVAHRLVYCGRELAAAGEETLQQPLDKLSLAREPLRRVSHRTTPS